MLVFVGPPKTPKFQIKQQDILTLNRIAELSNFMYTFGRLNSLSINYSRTLLIDLFGMAK